MSQNSILFVSNDSIAEFKRGYKFNQPFPFTFIDNFLKPDKLKIILDEVNALKSENADTKFNNPQHLFEFNKYAFTSNIGKNVQSLFEELVSDEFISYIETCTGISGLIRNDTTLFGAGIHRIHKGGYLGVHTDFNIFYSKKYGLIDRRINLLLYLNQDWKEEYKGELWLCNYFNSTLCYRILPIANRCVMFNTSTVSLHGHPDVLACPDNMQRQSIAIYYYTKNTNQQSNMSLQKLYSPNNGIKDFEDKEYHGTVFYDTKQFKQ
jgi:Rps23 Pro-64 3,4-dihydroxylase Tpa1-like proline 4-hydroxylase